MKYLFPIYIYFSTLLEELFLNLFFLYEISCLFTSFFLYIHMYHKSWNLEGLQECVLSIGTLCLGFLYDWSQFYANFSALCSRLFFQKNFSMFLSTKCHPCSNCCLYKFLLILLLKYIHMYVSMFRTWTKFTATHTVDKHVSTKIF